MKIGVPRMIDHFSQWGLEIHVGKPEKESKTKILFCAAPEKTYMNPATFDDRDLSELDLGAGNYIPVTDKFTYLGSILRGTVETTKMLRRALT